MQLHNPLNPATGLEDPTMLPWTSGNPATGVEGSYPPLGIFTDPQTEIVNVIVQAGLVPSEADLGQLAEAIARLIGSAVGSIKLPTVPGPGEGNVLDGNGNIAWNIPGLADEKTIGATDLVAFQQMVAGEGGLVAGHARRMSFSTFAATVLNPALILQAIGSVKTANPLPSIVFVQGIPNVYTKIVWNNIYGSMEGAASITLNGQDYYDFTLPDQFTTDALYTVLYQDTNNVNNPPGGPGADITGAAISGGVVRLFARDKSGNPWVGPLTFHYTCEGHQ